MNINELIGISSSFSVYKIISYILPALALWLLARCLRSMLSHKAEPELWGALTDSSGTKYPIKHWDCVIGRAASADIVLPDTSVARTHATLSRTDEGIWRLKNLGPKESTKLNGKTVTDVCEIKSGDKIKINKRVYTFRPLSETGRAKLELKRTPAGFFVSSGLTLMILTLFQGFLVVGLTEKAPNDVSINILLSFSGLIFLEWLFYLLMRLMRRSGFEPEIIAFFLSGLGLFVVASSTPNDLFKALIIIVAGAVGFLFLGWWLRGSDRTTSLRWLAAAVSVAVLVGCALFGTEIYGAKNWFFIGGISVQPSEFVKLAYVYTGAATLDKLFSRRNLITFIAFSAICVISLTLMGDFGTAVIFFGTFLVIAFMRSGSFATVFLAISGAAIASFLVLTIKPYIAKRFATWGNVWSDVWGAGFQQTKAISAVASGGLLGKGPGSGSVKRVFAADTDMVFSMLAEELGLIVAIVAVLAVIALGVFAARNAALGRSTYFAIAGCAAADMMMIQMSLNVFGTLDILPFTGVTFPFVSKGGSSLLACWLLLAFVKATDTRRDASFVVKAPVSPEVFYESTGEAGK